MRCETFNSITPYSNVKTRMMPTLKRVQNLNLHQKLSDDLDVSAMVQIGQMEYSERHLCE
jgi:hypothetical protein